MRKRDINIFFLNLNSAASLNYVNSIVGSGIIGKYFLIMLMLVHIFT